MTIMGKSNIWLGEPGRSWLYAYHQYWSIEMHKIMTVPVLVRDFHNINFLSVSFVKAAVDGLLPPGRSPVFNIFSESYEHFARTYRSPDTRAGREDKRVNRGEECMLWIWTVAPRKVDFGCEPITLSTHWPRQGCCFFLLISARV